MSDSLLNAIQSVCRTISGSHCNVPRLTDWRLVAPSQSHLSIDVADIATAGAGAVVPINIKIHGGTFLCGLENPRLGYSTQMEGIGVGGGMGAGWGIPFVGGRLLGSGSSIKKAILEKIGGSLQNKLIDLIKGQIFDGLSGGTRIIAGPDTPGYLRDSDFHDCIATIVSLSTNFTTIGVSAGLLITAKTKPVVQVPDLIYARAIGIIAGIGLATSLDVGVSGFWYRTKFAFF